MICARCNKSLNAQMARATNKFIATCPTCGMQVGFTAGSGSGRTFSIDWVRGGSLKKPANNMDPEEKYFLTKLAKAIIKQGRFHLLKGFDLSQLDLSQGDLALIPSDLS